MPDTIYTIDQLLNDRFADGLDPGTIDEGYIRDLIVSIKAYTDTLFASFVGLVEDAEAAANNASNAAALATEAAAAAATAAQSVDTTSLKIFALAGARR